MQTRDGWFKKNGAKSLLGKMDGKRSGMIFLIVVAFCFAMTTQLYQRPYADVSYAMDTFVEYHLYSAGTKQSKALKEEIDAQLLAFENRFSQYRPDSEIAQLNAAAGKEAVTLSDDVFTLLARSQIYMQETDGVFNVMVKPLVSLWDISAEHPQVPDRAAVVAQLPLVDQTGLTLDTQAKTAKLETEGMGVDLGAIAKGYACDMVRETLKARGVTSGYVSIGGNLMVIGDKPDGTPFKFGIRHPRAEGNKFIMVVNLKDLTMATSGDYERYFEQDGERYHHIFDPKTGYPAQTEWMSVSVISENGAYADAMSTYFFIAGKNFLLEHYDEFDCGVIAIDRDCNVYITPKAQQQVLSCDDDTFTYEVLP